MAKVRPMQSVFVYQDYIHNNGILMRRLRDTFGADAVIVCDAGDIIGRCLDDSVGLFVMPGGADLYYCEKLNGAGNAAIRSYVENGGAYLGICAGAYYACRDIVWAADEGSDAIIGPRELAFLDATAVGPLPEYIEDFEGSWAGVARLVTAEGPAVAALYRGGCAFEPAPGSLHETIATYDLPGSPAAIVKASVGDGMALLSGVHLEHTPAAFAAELYRHNNPSHEHNSAVLSAFAESWGGQPDLWDRYVATLLGD